MYINIDQLRSQLSSTKNSIIHAENKIKALKEAITKRKNPDLLKQENENLKLTHQLGSENIRIYNEKILKLKNQFKMNEEVLLKLREKNKQLKIEKNAIKQESKPSQNVISNFKDLYKSINLKKKTDLKSDNVKNIVDNRIKDKENIKTENFEKINKIKHQYENILDKLKDKANQINYTLKKQNEIIDGYRNYLNEIQIYLNKLRAKLNISVNNVALYNNNAQLNEFSSLFDNVSLMLFKLYDIFLENKNNYGQNIENVLINIQTNINELNLDENKKELNFKFKCHEINKFIEVIKIIFNNFEISKNKFDSNYKVVVEEIKKLKMFENQFTQQNQKKVSKDKIDANTANEINKQNINNENRKKIIEQSFLFNFKNASNKLDLYKTKNLFQNDDKSNDYLWDPRQLKKNYHEICYIYDDFDMYDIYYILKAVGLPDNCSFHDSYIYFQVGFKLEIQEFSLNDVPSQCTILNKSIISFKIKLHNLETVKVHIKVKAIKDLSNITKGELEQRSVYRHGYYGLSPDLEGEKVKYSLILKGSFDIVNFSKYFLIRNINNKKEIEYIWGGIVPPKGNTVLIMFSKKEAIWSFSQVIKYNSNSCFQYLKVFVPVEFVGVNNEIINISPLSVQATNITLDEKKRQYIFEFINTKHKSVEIIIKGELKNKCKGGWDVDLTDEEIEKLMPKEDVECKEQLKIIAKRIINDFDNSHKNSDIEYLDYMKIGFWVKENLIYDYKYTGKQISAMEIYSIKKGVCHHFTVLTNALLYSLGYKVLYMTGYCCQNSKTFSLNDLHAYSLIKLENNKWYPFDSTWGILTGKIHVGHIFRMFGNKMISKSFSDNITSHSLEVNGKFIK